MTFRTSVIVLCFVSTPAIAGDLNPPAGPVAPTPGPEPRIAISATNTPGDADSVFKITAPGSYYLTANLNGGAGKNGIEISASGVTVDLMGFQIVGTPTSLHGVATSFAGLSGVEVRNGTVRTWGQGGVDLAQFTTIDSRVVDLRCIDNAVVGMTVATGSSVIGCIAEGNDQGISTFGQCQLRDCIARNNASSGFSCGNGCTVTGCTAGDNATTGIAVQTSGMVSNCAAYSNDGSGITLTYGCTVQNCSVISNGLDGISMTSGGCLITECNVSSNFGDGILITVDSRIIGNTCDSNGAAAGDGANIHVTSTDNRIEGNNCTDADRGIDVDAGGNFITRNVCSGNSTNWDVALGNVILVVNATTSAAVSGNAGGSAPGSTDPNANFTY